MIGAEKASRHPAPDSDVIDRLLKQFASDSATRSAPSAVRRRLQAVARLRAGGLPARSAFTLGLRWALPLAGGAALLAILLLSSSGEIAFRSRSAVFSISQWVGLHPHPDATDTERTAEIAQGDNSFPVSSDTYAVPYSDPSIANGTEAILHVSLPDSELLAWGVPSLGREPDDLVPVDLTLGDDGLPRSVRLLPTATSTSEEIYP